MTNFEKIKGMDMDEMAAFINDVTGCNCCSRRGYEMCEEVGSCEPHIKEWLESEAGE